MNKNIKKNIIYILLFIAAITFIAYNHNISPTEINNSNNTAIPQPDSDEPTGNNNSQPHENLNNLLVDNSSIEIDENDIIVIANPHNFITNSKEDYDPFFLVPFFKDDVKIKSSPIEKEYLDRISDIKDLRADEYYSKDSTGYDNLTDEVIFKYIGDLDIKYNSVKYINYFSDEKAVPKQNWIKHFEARMSNEYEKPTDTPVTIKESWSFNYMGNEIEIVKSGNTIYTADREAYSRKQTDYDIYEKIENLPQAIVPYGENHILYEMTSIFLNDEVVYQDAISVDEISTKCISGMSHENWIGISFVPPEDDTYFEFKFYSFQCDNYGNIIKCPVFVDHTGGLGTENFVYSSYFALMDTDNDLKLEILHYNTLGQMYLSSGITILMEI